MDIRSIAAILLVPISVVAYPQWVAGSEDGFALAVPGYQFTFPHDHGSHDEYQTEWWYYSGQIQTASGRPYGFQLTFFRRGRAPDLPVHERTQTGPIRRNASRWTATQIYVAHFAVSDIAEKRFWYGEKISRAGLGKAGAETGTLSVWIDRWAADLQRSSHRLRAQIRDEQTFKLIIAMELTLSPQRPPVVHGIDGVSVKGAGIGQASHYYSMTRMATHGWVSLDGKQESVAGFSWMDHEFGTSQLSGQQVGWDWFGLQLDNGMDLMVYRLRLKNDDEDPASSGTLVLEDGQSIHLDATRFHLEPRDSWTSPKSTATYPLFWRLTIPSLRMTLDIAPQFADQELITSKSTDVTYWEGAVRVSAEINGISTGGRGYMELTGYAGSLAERF